MFENFFLAYVLYITMVEMRTKALENNDSRSYWLMDILHNVPLSLLQDDSALEEYQSLMKYIKKLGINEWLDARMKEFLERNPEYNKEDF